MKKTKENVQDMINSIQEKIEVETTRHKARMKNLLDKRSSLKEKLKPYCNHNEIIRYNRDGGEFGQDSTHYSCNICGENNLSPDKIENATVSKTINYWSIFKLQK